MLSCESVRYMPLTGLVIALTGGGSDARRVLSTPAVDTYVAPQRTLTRHGFQARCASGVYSRLFRRGNSRTAFYGPKAQISKGLSHEHYLLLKIKNAARHCSCQQHRAACSMGLVVTGKHHACILPFRRVACQGENVRNRNYASGNLPGRIRTCD